MKRTSGTQDLTDDDIGYLEIVRRVVATVCKDATNTRGPIDSSIDLVALGVDSARLYEVAAQLESTLECELDSVELVRATTLGDIAALLANAVRQAQRSD